MLGPQFFGARGRETVRRAGSISRVLRFRELTRRFDDNLDPARAPIQRLRISSAQEFNFAITDDNGIRFETYIFFKRSEERVVF